MNYDEAIKFLFDCIPNYQKSGKTAIRKGLKNIKILSNRFNNPQNTFNSIHVGGTNGKGTTSVAIANFCLSLDLKIVGTMCIPPDNEDPKFFFNELSKLNQKLNLNEISMGMTNDYLVALEYNATFLRIGSGIFGERTK